MVRFLRKALLITAAAGLMAGASQAGDPHVHGQANLAAALDGKTLVIEFRSPQWNIVGFERAAQSDAEREALEGAAKTLDTAENLFALSEKAGCTLVNQAVALAGSGTQKDEHHDDHDHHDGDHDHDDHDHADHDDHRHDHKDEAHSDHADHSDTVATYTYECAEPGALDRITVSLFDAFEQLEAVDAVYLGPGAQMAATLNREAAIFSLR